MNLRHETLCIPVGFLTMNDLATGEVAPVFYPETTERGLAAERRSFQYSEWNIISGVLRIHLIVIYTPPYYIRQSNNILTQTNKMLNQQQEKKIILID